MNILSNKKTVTAIYVFALIAAYQIVMLLIKGNIANILKFSALLCIALLCYLVWKIPLFGLFTYFFVNYFMPRQFEVSEFISRDSVQMGVLSITIAVIIAKSIMTPKRSTAAIQESAIGTNKWIYLLLIFLLVFSSLDQMLEKIMFKMGLGGSSYFLLNLRPYFQCANAVLIGIVSKLTLRNYKDLTLLFKVIIAAGLIHALAGLAQYFLGISFMQLIGFKDEAMVLGGYSYTGTRLSSLLDTSPGSSARFILFPFFLSTFFLFKLGDILIDRAYYAALAVIMLLAIFLTFSRGTFLGIGTFTCILSIVGLSKGRWIIVFAPVLLAIILGLIFYDTFGERIAHDSRLFSSDNYYGRLELFDAGLSLLKDNLIRGVGIGNSAFFAYKFALIPLFAGYSSLHNFFLEFVVNVGVGGIIFFVLIIYKTIASFYRSASNTPTSWNRFGFFMIASYIGILVPILASTENILPEMFLFLTISEKASQSEKFWPSDPDF